MKSGEGENGLSEVGWGLAAKVAGAWPKSPPSTSSSRPPYDVFLGGSCGWTSWRQEKIIPQFKAAGITYFNPQKNEWSKDLIAVEEAAKNSSRLLLFVIDPQTANNVGLLEIAYLAAKKYPLIVVLPSREEFLEISCCDEDSHDRGRAYDVVSTLLAAEEVEICRTVEKARERIEEIVIGDLWAAEALRSSRCRWPYLRLKTRRLARVCSAPLRARVLAGLVRRVFGPEYLQPLAPPTGRHLCQRSESSQSSASTDSEPGTRWVGGPWSETSWPLLAVQAVFCLMSYLVHPALAVAFLVLAGISHAAPTSLHVRLKRDVNNNRSGRRRGGEGRRRSRRSAPLSFDVFLGSSGDGGERDWIQERAIPLLNKSGLSYFDSRLYNGNDYDWAAVMEASSRILFSVASPYSTFSGFIQLAYYIGKQWDIVACVPDNVQVGHSSHPDSPSLVRGRGLERSLAYLRDVAERENCSILPDLGRALRRCIAEARDTQ